MFNAMRPRTMTRTLRVLAALLAYPDERMRGCLPALREMLREEHALPRARRVEIEALIDAIVRADPLDAEADYVELFDRGRGTSLLLFEHVHGDSRDRGPAMIDLAQTYEKAGLYLAQGEMPDFLPVVLEFASTQEPRVSREFLGEMTHILSAIFAALQARGSAYASVLGALLELAGVDAQPVKPVVEESLDESWAEPVVFDGCSSRGQAGPGQAQPVHIVRNANPAQRMVP